MRIFILSDLHAAIADVLGTERFPLGAYLTKDDYLILLGDLELHLFNYAGLKFLESCPWTTLVLDGNHDNLPDFFGAPLEEKFGGHVGVFYDNIFYLRRGEVYTIFGKKFFTMGGALSIDRNTRMEGMSWWEEEVPTEDDYRHAEHCLDYSDWEVDYVLTHTCPLSAIDLFGFPVHPNEKYYDKTWDRFEVLLHKMKVREWYFGHWHRDLVAEQNGVKFHSVYLQVRELKI